MEKIFKKKTIFYHNQSDVYTFGKLKSLLKEKNIILEDNDIINVSFQKGYYTENNSMDDCFIFNIERNVLETDDEFNKRIQKNERENKFFKERRYETYLKLKKEFENG